MKQENNLFTVEIAVISYERFCHTNDVGGSFAIKLIY